MGLKGFFVLHCTVVLLTAILQWLNPNVEGLPHSNHFLCLLLYGTSPPPSAIAEFLQPCNAPSVLSEILHFRLHSPPVFFSISVPLARPWFRLRCLAKGEPAFTYKPQILFFLSLLSSNYMARGSSLSYLCLYLFGFRGLLGYNLFINLSFFISCWSFPL